MKFIPFVSKKLFRMIAVCVLLTLVEAGWADLPSMRADILTNIETEFGVYRPHAVDGIHAVEAYHIADDFRNVANMNDFQFSPEEKRLLLQNGFVVTPSPFREMYDIYNEAQNENYPIFVTVDALLHTYHELFDYILRTIETRKFIADLRALSQTLLDASRNQWNEASDVFVKEAALKNIAFFSIAVALLDETQTTPPEVFDLAESELNLITNHSVLTDSPLFGYMEDYTQYLPRGHYTLSDELGRYFCAMMWYGRMTFHAEAGGFYNIPLELAEEATRRALLITQLLNQIQVGDEPALAVWNRIYQPTVFFVGKSDDLSVLEYSSLIRTIYGNDFTQNSVDQFADPNFLSKMMTAVMDLPAPRIVPELNRGFRFMGQRFIPDSYMFTELVIDRTSRAFPRGLDVMAILGSQRAYEILDQFYQETNDSAYVSQMASLIDEFSSLPDEKWAQNLYWNWLYCLMPLLAEKGDGFPFYMQNTAWRDKELSCALGSWAELRHDTILYAKQSYTLRGGMPAFNYANEFVEPNPWAFARLSSLTRFMMDGLQSQNLLFPEFGDRLEQMCDLLISLKAIAEKELTNQSLTIGEKRLIRTISDALTQLTIFDSENDRPGDHLDEDMAVIADVHTDISRGFQVLEVGVGRPLNLYVIVGNGDALQIAVGSVFSYYEFTSNERLTDEAWQEMLDNGTAPELPGWMNSFIDLANMTTTERRQYSTNSRAYTQGSMTFSAAPEKPKQGETVTLYITLDNAPGSEFVLEAVVGAHRIVTPLVPDAGTTNPDDYIAIVDTKGWPEGTVLLTVYGLDTFSAFYQSSLPLAVGVSAVTNWECY
ncbi:MAG: DUF3160 domain-containing protein [Candidatus Omnitrophota bacterium]|jgi:hypothetical protein|nr:MAG: DUF3160 domain-containing protein [Candidatus Omnitrophota bacterium]